VHSLKPGEPGTFPRPGALDFGDAAPFAFLERDPDMQVGQIIKEVFVAPNLLGCLADLAFVATDGTACAAVVDEIYGDVQPLYLVGERNGGNLPGMEKTECCGKDVVRYHW
jgi:hypothetical protein